jgi:glycosyltransferase involved in cell wall biosynthesis
VADKPLKTLLIIPSVNPAGSGQRIGLGGTERMTLNLCQHLDRSAIEPHLLVFHEPDAARETLEQHGVKVHQLRKRGRLDPLLWSGLRRLIVKERFDAVLSMLQGTNLHNLLVTPTVPGVACLISYRGGKVYPWLARTEGRIAYRAQRLITPAAAVAEEVAKQYRIAQSRVVRIPNGCDSSRFAPRDAQSQLDSRKQLGLPIDSLVLYTPSRIDQAKGQDIMAAALIQLQPLLASKEVIWVNTGQVQDLALKDKVEGMVRPFAGRVKLLDATDRPEDWYSASDIVVLPSRVEAFSNVLLEAAFSGRLFVAAAVGETSRVASKIGGGLIFDGSPSDLAARLSALIRRPREELLADGLGLAEPARKHYSLARTAQMFTETIAAAVSERRSGA